MDIRNRDSSPAERRLPPGGFRRILTTPDGDQAGLQGQPGQTPPPHTGTPPSGPLPPGGYYAIIETPDGPAGLNRVSPPSEPPAT